MIENLENRKRRRWYDEKKYTSEVLEKLQKMSLQMHYDIARDVLGVIDTVKKNTRGGLDQVISLGLPRLIGLYSQVYGRRWYDKNLPINRIFKSASTLQNDDFQNIMHGMYSSLKDDDE